MKHILIVEDDPWQAELMARQLARRQFSVKVASDGIEAFAAIDARVPDVIVLDMMLPGPNGMTVLHELRSHADSMSIPVIVCSSQPGISASILKPYGVVAVHDKATMSLDAVVTSARGASL